MNGWVPFRGETGSALNLSALKTSAGETPGTLKAVAAGSVFRWSLRGLTWADESSG
jgi:hypothetical protein